MVESKQIKDITQAQNEEILWTAAALQSRSAAGREVCVLRASGDTFVSHIVQRQGKIITDYSRTQQTSAPSDV